MLLLPYINYEAYGQPRTFSTAPGVARGGGCRRRGELEVVGTVGMPRWEEGSGRRWRWIRHRFSQCPKGRWGVCSSGGGGSVSTPSWMGPK